MSDGTTAPGGAADALDEGGAAPSPAKAARLLSVLLITPEDDLAGFRQRMLGKDSDVPLEHLRAARDALVSLGAALSSVEEAAWQKVSKARDLLATGRGPSVAEATAPPSAPAALPHPPAASPRHVAPPSVTSPTQPAAPHIESGPVQSAWVSGPPARGVAPSAPTAPAAPPEGATAPPFAPPPAAPALVPSAAPHLPVGKVETMDEVVPASARNPLPFQQGPAQLSSDAARALSDEANADNPNLGATVGVDQISPLAGLLPFAKSNTRESASPPPAPSLTLEQYASLCAQCAEMPRDTYRIHREFGLVDLAARAQLDKSFAARFDAEPAQRNKFDELVAHYREWFRKSPSSPP